MVCFLPQLRWFLASTLFCVVLSSCTEVQDSGESSSIKTSSSSIMSTVSPTTISSEPEVSFPVPDRLTRVRMSTGMSRSLHWAATRMSILRTPSSPVDAYLASGSDACELNGPMLTAINSGSCSLIIDTDGGTGQLDVEVMPNPTRSDVDRPGSTALHLKPVYVRLADSPDRERDVNGEIAGFVQQIADWMAVQNPGFTIRVDLHEGVPDVQHVELPITKAEMLDQWDLDIGPLMPLLREAGLDDSGWPASIQRAWEISPSRVKQIYVGLVEGPRGQYNSPLSTTDGGCGISSNNPFMLFFTEELDGSPCWYMESVNYQGPDDEDWLAWDLIPRMFDTFLGHPGCDRTIANQYVIPEFERDNYKVPENDIKRRTGFGRKPPFELDPSRSFYFGITEGEKASDPCHDIAYSHFWTDVAYDEVRVDQLEGRTSADRPDDLTGPQVRVYYVLPADGPDRMWDINGTLDRAVKTANEWLFAKGEHHVRFDLHDGELDVGFVRLPEHEGDLWMDPSDPTLRCTTACPEPWWIHQRLDQLGVLSPDKTPVIVYGGGIAPTIRVSGIGCAMAYGFDNVLYGGFVSPAVRSFMSGWAGCLGGMEATLPETENSLGLVIIHEILHVIGAVDFDAPDENGTGHLVDPFDLMGASLGPIRLDPERRNYWAHGRNDIVDVTKSPLLVPSAPPWSPVASSTSVVGPWWQSAVPQTFRNSWSPMKTSGSNELAGRPEDDDQRIDASGSTTSTSTSTTANTLPPLTLPTPSPGATLPRGNLTQEQTALAGTLNTAFDTDPKVTSSNRAFTIYGGDQILSNIDLVIERIRDLPDFNFVVVSNPRNLDCPTRRWLEKCVSAKVRLVVMQQDAGIELEPIWVWDQGRWRLMDASFCEFAAMLSVPC